MMFRSRLNPSAHGHAAILAVAALLPLMALVGGCEDKHI